MANAMNRLGMWSAFALFVVGVAYLPVLALGMASAGLQAPIVDPVLAIMEILTLLSAPLLVVVMVAVHYSAPSESRAHSLTAVVFAAIAAGLTSGVHFVGLTALRQTGAAGLQWPSSLYALELLAWDVFLGLALLFAAPTFRGGGLRRGARLALGIAGGLSLLGTIGPIVGDMRWQRLGILGYGAVLPVAALLLAMLFRRESIAATRTAG